VRAALAILCLAGTAYADLPTIDSEFPPTLRINATNPSALERVAVAIHSAPEVSWVTIIINEGGELPIDVPSGTFVTGVAITTDTGAAWGHALPWQRARVAVLNSPAALIEFESASADLDHLRLQVNTAAKVEIALLLPPLARLAVDTNAAHVKVDVDGVRVLAAKRSQRRPPIELSDVAGTTMTKRAFAADGISLVAAPSAATDFLEHPLEPRQFRGDIDKTIIRRYVKRHLPQVRQCYMHAAQWSGAKNGGATLSFQIISDGTVDWATTIESDLPEAVNACLIAEMQRWQFPEGQGTVVVNYPLEFRTTW
jgi:hypothetical protein